MSQYILKWFGFLCGGGEKIIDITLYMVVVIVVTVVVVVISAFTNVLMSEEVLFLQLLTLQ